MKKCYADNCEKESYWSGLCTMHIQRMRKYGSPYITKYIKGDSIRRFWSKVEYTDSCWLWVGATYTSGYGCFKFEGRNRSAHRFIYEYYDGILGDGLQIDHLCRVRNCVNPSHLEAVTCLENIRRRGKVHL